MVGAYNNVESAWRIAVISISALLNLFSLFLFPEIQSIISSLPAFFGNIRPAA